MRIGERVLVAGQRTGVVKFCGKTNFAPGRQQQCFRELRKNLFNILLKEPFLSSKTAVFFFVRQASGWASNWTSPVERTMDRWVEYDTSAAHQNTVFLLPHHAFKGESEDESFVFVSCQSALSHRNVL